MAVVCVCVCVPLNSFTVIHLCQPLENSLKLHPESLGLLAAYTDLQLLPQVQQYAYVLQLLTVVSGGVKRREQVIQFVGILFHRLWSHDIQNTRAHETTRPKIQRTKTVRKNTHTLDNRKQARTNTQRA